MSTSRRKGRVAGRAAAHADDFAAWLAATFGEHGDFTALVVLVRIAEMRVTPLASTFLTFVGEEVTWAEVAGLFAGAKKAWDGAAFFPVLNAEGPLANEEARARLRILEERIRSNRLVLNEGAFFDLWGRKMKVEEIAPN